MTRQTTPADLMMLYTRSMTLWAEASMVMGMRMMGMAGFWTTRPDETVRMVAEKPAAFAEAAMASATAAMHGRRPDQIATAAIRPISKAAHANRMRLAKAGPKRKG